MATTLLRSGDIRPTRARARSVNDPLRRLAFASVGALALAFSALSAAAQTGPQVTVDTGRLQGAREGDVRVFRGIPFAAPPVGNRRWREPALAPAWEGVRDATQFGAACLQPGGRTEPWAQVGPTSEDCLFLNVWRPDTEATGLPVMVFIHGGGFTYGSPSVPLYDGVALAERGVVLITINYRLSRLGFFAHPALTAEDPDGRLGNYGLMDAVAALQWVQRNAAAFGGDAGNVTLFGESAGAGMVQLLMASDEANGLFHKAISQSGAGGTILAPIRGAAPNAAETIGRTWAEQHGLSDATAEQLRAMPIELVPTDRGAPMIDGRVVRASPGAPFGAGTEAKVPMLIGANSHENTLYGDNDTIVRAILGADYDGFLERYQAANDGSRDDARRELREDVLSLQQSMFVGQMHAANGAPTWAYNFRQVRSDEREGSLGTMHGGEMEFLFGALPEGQVWDDADREASRLTGDYWVRFARTGDPNGDGAPEWRPLSPTQGDYLVIDAQPHMAATTPLEDEVRARTLSVATFLWSRQ